LNCIGIAQSLRELGAKPVFICHEHFQGTFRRIRFRRVPDPASQPIVGGGAPALLGALHRAQHSPTSTRPLAQIDSYVAPAWDAIIDTAIEAEKPCSNCSAG
jgi:UDP:flavonoid glycosyltransferase YjiC (YdhE family)